MKCRSPPDPLAQVFFRGSIPTMKSLLLLTLALLSFSTTTLAITPRAKKMKAFRSERELERYFHKIAERQKRARKLKVAETDEAMMTETVTVTSSSQPEE